MLICDIESAHTGTREDSGILKYAGCSKVNVFELMYVFIVLVKCR